MIGAITTRPAALAPTLSTTPPAQLPGKTLAIDSIGCKTIDRVDVANNALYLRGADVALNLQSLVRDGAAVCLGTSEALGSARLLPPASTPYWFDRGEATLTHRLLNATVGQMRVFPESPLEPEKLRLQIPDELRRSSPEMQVYCSELCGMIFCTPTDDARKCLINRGYKDVRLYERNSAVALAAVTPDERAILVVWRCASDVSGMIGSIDRRKFSDGLGDPVPRGVNRYIGQVREPLDAFVSDLVAKYPDASVLVTSNSLGGGAALQWTDQSIRSGLIPQERIGQLAVFNPVPGLWEKRAHELAATLGERLDVVVHHKDPLRWVLGVDRAHYGHIDYVDDTRAKWPLLFKPMQGFHAHMVSSIKRIIGKETVRMARALRRSVGIAE